MKKASRYVAVVLVLISIFTITVSARGSDNINSYYANINRASSTKVSIDFFISCTATMSKLGASSVVLYENGSYKSTLYNIYDYDDWCMGGNATFYNCTSGKTYYAIVYYRVETYNGGWSTVSYRTGNLKL